MLRSVALRGHRVLGERELLTEARLTWGEPFSYLGREDGSQTYPNRRYFLGGVDTLRGFNQDQLLPQDLADLTL
ncbi:MAG: hypothetical protein K8H88_18025, partial [Sandaracinaceae bacterium]|nr:hypothetical protein [Sandaracinaceae bacterium]